jgi:predicted small lipoprotein YifL
MRSLLHSLLLLAVLGLLAACSEQKKSPTEQPNAAPVVTPADTAAALDTVAAKPAAPSRSDTTYVQDVAAYLAGQRVSQKSPLQPLTAQPTWQAFAADANKSWKKYHTTRTSKIEKWATAELDSVRASSSTIFYPFSGPDLLNVVTMFPRSSTYVLVGLEPVGSVPRRATLKKARLFPAVKASLWSVLNFSFFRTNDMAIDLKSLELDGSLPLMLLFATRTGHQVHNVRYVQLNSEGQLTAADSSIVRKRNSQLIPGVEMTMLNKAGDEQKVYYFSADISDGKVSNKGAVIQYVKSLGPLTTYVKSASYLMHKSYFSEVRNVILERSNYILQDDSGIAMQYFRPADWQFTHYGIYKRPINLFANHYQRALTKAYTDTANPPRALPFGTGYNWRQNDSNLLLARRQTPL